jgi:hypothetical protein
VKKTTEQPLPTCLAMARLKAQPQRDIEVEITHSFRCPLCREQMNRDIEAKNPRLAAALRDFEANPEKYIVGLEPLPPTDGRQRRAIEAKKKK